MRVAFLTCSWLQRTAALQALAVAMLLHLGACKGDDDSGDSGKDAGTAGCAADHDHDHAAESDGGSEPDHDAIEIGPPSGATCPKDNTLTYDNFGKTFMTTYCTKCHSSKNSCAQRMSAPLGHDFDSFPGIIGVADHIDEYAAGGPQSINRTMPLTGNTKPSDDDRKKLGQWLACEQDKLNGPSQ